MRLYRVMNFITYIFVLQMILLVLGWVMGDLNNVLINIENQLKSCVATYNLRSSLVGSQSIAHIMQVHPTSWRDLRLI